MILSHLIGLSLRFADKHCADHQEDVRYPGGNCENESLPSEEPHHFFDQHRRGKFIFAFDYFESIEVPLCGGLFRDVTLFTLLSEISSFITRFL